MTQCWKIKEETRFKTVLQNFLIDAIQECITNNYDRPNMPQLKKAIIISNKLVRTADKCPFSFVMHTIKEKLPER